MALDNVTAKSWASSLLGIDYEVKRTANLQTALSKPGDYFALRGAALTQIQKDINEEFVKKFESLLAQNLPRADAQHRAEAWATSLYNAKLQELNLDYPASIQQLSANLLYKKGSAASGGTDYSNVAGSKPRGGRKQKLLK